ncbi:DUF3196 family protein [Caldalkalibacillus mannanilyticus]|uniref:DUF3196 family protein n=1 Tax=Caldalkalibacillus mannanilyticus TaxID=1418 RepID=UPI000469A46E|nr:DUF3196 family protein [Caldalkalibacillus mannanilyticus]
MDDNIIPFPNFSKKDRLEQGEDECLTPEIIHNWKQGLLSEAPKQWNTYERMFGFIDEDVQEIIRLFLVSEQGDKLLKTRFLQKLKLICPGKLSFIVYKSDQKKELMLSEVPVEKEEWSEEVLSPLVLLEEKAYDNPSLIELAKEMWFFFLEKEYPFIPEMNDPLLWTAAIHSYTLRMVDFDMSGKSVEKLALLYEMEEKEFIHACSRFETILQQV